MFSSHLRDMKAVVVLCVAAFVVVVEGGSSFFSASDCPPDWKGSGTPPLGCTGGYLGNELKIISGTKIVARNRRYAQGTVPPTIAPLTGPPTAACRC